VKRRVNGLRQISKYKIFIILITFNTYFSFTGFLLFFRKRLCQLHHLLVSSRIKLFVPTQKEAHNLKIIPKPTAYIYCIWEYDTTSLLQPDRILAHYLRRSVFPSSDFSGNVHLCSQMQERLRTWLQLKLDYIYI